MSITEIKVVDEQNGKTYAMEVCISESSFVMKNTIEKALHDIGVTSDWWNAYDLDGEFICTSED